MNGFFRLPRPLTASPNRWLAAFQRQLAWLNVVEREAGWVADFAGLDVRLTPAPFWGYALEWLTSRASTDASSQPGPPNVERSRRTASPTLTEQQRAVLPDLPTRSGQQRHASDAIRSDEVRSAFGTSARLHYPTLPHDPSQAGADGQTASTALALSRQAQISSLRRLAGGSAGTQAAPAARIRFSNARGKAPVYASPDAIRLWQAQVARRAAASLSQLQATQEQSPDAPAAESWARMVSGIAAPPALLRALANGGAEPPEQAQAGRKERAAEQPARSKSAPQTSEGWSGAANGGDPSGTQARPVAHHVDTPSAPEAESIRPVSPDVLPPRSSRVLSPLITPQQPGEPVMPVVKQLMQGAWAEDSARHEEDDLSDLAAKVRRILEEESRRFGIDV